jgi:hypothetical protein
MPFDVAALQRLVERVGAFYITDKAMLSAQRAIEGAFAAGSPDADSARAYVRAVRSYFVGFEREAREHLRALDKRLENANQVVFNLTAERGVAVKRIEATQGVLGEVSALDEAPA